MFEKQYLQNLIQLIDREEYLKFLMIRAMNKTHATEMYKGDFLDTITSLEEEISRKSYPANKIGVSYRIINHWTDKGILADDRDQNSREWRKFSFSDLVWVKILEELREYGLSLDKIKNIYDSVKLGIHGYQNIFENYLVLCLIQAPLYLSISCKGAAETSLALTPIRDAQTSNIQIYVHRIVDNIIDRQQDYKVIETPKENISQQHRQVLGLLQQDNWNEMKIMKKGHDIKDCLVSENVDLSKPLNEILEKIPFGNLSLNRENGKNSSATQIKRKRISKK